MVDAAPLVLLARSAGAGVIATHPSATSGRRGSWRRDGRSPELQERVVGGDVDLVEFATDRELGVGLRVELCERVLRNEIEAASEVGDARGERPAVGVSDPSGIDLGSRRVAVGERLACGDVLGTRDDSLAAVDGVEDFVVQPQDEAEETLGSRGVEWGSRPPLDDVEQALEGGRVEVRGDTDPHPTREHHLQRLAPHRAGHLHKRQRRDLRCPRRASHRFSGALRLIHFRRFSRSISGR